MCLVPKRATVDTRLNHTETAPVPCGAGTRFHPILLSTASVVDRVDGRRHLHIIMNKHGALLMANGSSRADLYSNPEDARAEECVGPWPPRNDLVQTEDVVEIVRSLRRISDILESRPINHRTGGALVRESDFWLDDDYVYVDIPYAETDELMMDICVQGGRAFIRVVREGLGAEPVELPVESCPPQFLLRMREPMRQS
jgi:hypothetical protein